MNKISKAILIAALALNSGYIPSALAIPRSPASVSSDQQLDQLKIQLLDLKQELAQEQGHFGYYSSKRIRNLAATISALSGIVAVIDSKIGTNRNFLFYGLISGVAGIISLLGEVGVGMTNDQVETLEKKIDSLERQIEYAEQNLR